MINITNYNPNHALFVNKNDREKITYWKCCNKDNCEAYKNGRCIMFYHIFDIDTCPYGKKETQIGFTKAARKCGSLELMAKSKHPDLFFKLKEQMTFARIGEYLFFPISCLFNSRNPFKPLDSDFFCKSTRKLIKATYYNAEILKELCEYVPLTKFSYGVIEQYQKKYLPEFLQKLKLYDKQMYQELINIYPQSEEIAKTFSFIGKKAMLSTLSSGKVKLGNNMCEWDGRIIKFLGIPVLFGQKGEYFYKPNQQATAEICDETTVNENTVLID